MQIYTMVEKVLYLLPLSIWEKDPGIIQRDGNVLYPGLRCQQTLKYVTINQLLKSLESPMYLQGYLINLIGATPRSWQGRAARTTLTQCSAIAVQ